MIKKVFILIGIGLILISGYFVLNPKESLSKEKIIQDKPKDYSKYAQEALEYSKKHKTSEAFFILIDFSIHSGKKRMFIWDFKQNKITHRYLVSHGSGKNPTAKDASRDNPKFSNIENSHCSSLGKYHIGRNKVPSIGFGEKYLLYGKDSTNSNALMRNVVIHPWKRMPDKEPYPRGVAESWGCPAVSQKVFDELHLLIQSTERPVLLWTIYDK